MADNVQLPPTGTGTADVVIATDDSSGAHVQLIKLAYSGDGLRTAVSAGSSGLLVDLGSNNDVTVTGTVTANLSATDNAVLDTIDAVLDTIKVDTEAIETAVEGTLKVEGEIAENAAHNDVNPVLMGGRAEDVSGGVTAGAVGDVMAFRTLREGVLMSLGMHPDLERISNNYTAAQTDTVLKTVNSGFRFAVTAFAVLVDGTTTATNINAELQGTTTVLAKHPGIPSGGGWVEGDGSGVLFTTADAADLEFTCDVPTGGSVQVSVSGFLTAD